MSDYTCTVEGCARKFKARGWCNTHYEMWRKTGSPFSSRYATPQAQVADRTVSEAGCLLWTGYITPVGYGQMQYGGRARRVHAAVWEMANGKPPAGYVVDHICHNRRCCELSHLRLATEQENTWNRVGAMARSKTGVRNVSMNRHGKFTAMVTAHRQTYYLGSFETIDEADAAATAKREELFGVFAGQSRRTIERTGPGNSEAGEGASRH